jgi:Na+/serine symporter
MMTEERDMDATFAAALAIGIGAWLLIGAIVAPLIGRWLKRRNP